MKEDTKSPGLQKGAKNICAICEASGFPVCKGHGGGSSSTDEKDEEKSLSNSTSQILKSLSLVQSFPGLSPENILDYPNFNGISFSVDSMGVDIDSNNLRVIFSRNSISPNSFAMFKDVLQSTLNKIIKDNPEFTNQINSINLVASSDRIIIEIPSQKLFNMLIKELQNENLLPRDSLTEEYTNKQNQYNSADNQIAANLEASSTDNSTSPSPFAIQPEESTHNLKK